MTEPQRVYRSADVPDFASYPASPEEAIGRARVIELPSSEGNPDLESAARSIGSALGQAVTRLREKSDEVKGRVDEAAYRLRSQATEATRNYSELAQEKVDDARNRAQRLAKRAARDYPIHLILGAAVVGALIGVGLRVWRENDDEPYRSYLR